MKRLILVLFAFGLLLRAQVVPAVIGVNGDGSVIFPGNVKVGPTVLNVTSGVIVPLAIATTSPISPAATGFYLNNGSGAITYNLPAITTATVGLQMCFRNAVTKTGVITLTAPASTYIDVNGANGSAAGTLVSGGAAGDSACVVAVSTTQYMAFTGGGSWTNN